ncbi:MAG: ribosome maturation factor RimM [Chloroflexi bacterium]|nr:ribosome maturation factor RimM [Chloroflexota bacterium]
MSADHVRPAGTSSSADHGQQAGGSSAADQAKGPSALHPPEFLVVAQVLGAHGIRGELKCRIVTDFPTRRFRRGSSVVIGGQPHLIQAARVQGSTVLLKLQDIGDRDLAAALRGAEIVVPTDQAVSLPKGQFYWHQVIGLHVEDASSHEPLGEVTDIIETGANDVYVVRGEKGEILVPAIKDVVKQIDPASGRMLIQPLPGMLRG